MRAVARAWVVSSLVAIAMLAACSYTLRQDWAFKASETSSLAVFDYPLVTRDAPFSFTSFNMIEVDLQQQSLGAHRYVIGGIDTPKQLRPDINRDDGSLHELERTAQQTFFVPYQMAPGDYAIVGGFDVFKVVVTKQITLCNAPVFRIRPGSVSVVDARLLLNKAGFSFFVPDQNDSERTMRRAKIALHSYPNIAGPVELAEFLGVIRFPPQGEKQCATSNTFTVLSPGGSDRSAIQRED